ncbi:hypothetical protein CLOAM0076 [Candidatus Cloacimonas acidaminovorans str. Evry]|uniref:Uncharacterized protein n=1 Tax=Cloacimonas acidaminovorans (strain Evry) TaxID=459349 RepID=B0VIT0_CLOAI|nr:hypothetical protein CLOAM0076 [Candidatus Cloacimonas acidaminovorans str. Evry]
MVLLQVQFQIEWVSTKKELKGLVHFLDLISKPSPKGALYDQSSRKPNL